MAEDLKINITADVKDFNAELVSAQNQLRKFQAELKGSTDPSAITTLQAKIVDLKTKIDSLQSTNKNFVRGTNEARFALNDLSRVAQDAPYGFIGISNNINPLIDSFARLKGSTTSTKELFAALGSELTGIGGLGLAVGVITSAITLMDIGLTRWTGSTKNATDAAGGFASAVNQIKTSIDNTKTSIDEYNKSQQYFLELYNANLKERFGKGFQADLLLAEAKFISIGESIVFAQDKLPNFEKALDRSRRILNQYSKESVGAFDEQGISNFQKKLTDVISTFGGIENISKTALNGFNEKEKELISSVIDSYKALADQKNAIKDLYNQRELQAAQNRALIAENKKAEAQALAEKLKNLDTISKDYSKYIKSIQDSFQLFSILNPTAISADREELKKELGITISAIDHLIQQHNDSPQKKDIIIELKVKAAALKAAIDPAKAETTWDKTSLKDKLQEDLNKIKELPLKLPKIKWEMPKEIQGAVTKAVKESEIDVSQAFKDLGTSSIDAFTSALETGGTASTIGQNFFKGIGKAIGEGMITIGKQLLIFGLGLQKIKAELITNTTAAIFEAIALIAAGTVVKQTSAFATGTRNAPGGMAMVGERGPEMISLPKGSKVVPAAQTSSMMGAMQSVEVYGMLKGQDIYFSNKKYGQTYGRIA
jgi:hypothetical protein